MSGKNLNEVFQDPIVNKWLNTIVREGTKHVYKAAFRRYYEYTGLSGEKLMMEAVEDFKKDPWKRRDIVKQRVIGFYKWLLKQGLSEKIGHTYIGAIRSFYGSFGIVIKLSRRESLGRPRVRNKRRLLDPLSVKLLMDHAPTARDRAIIIMMFQSGMDVSTVCSLKYGDVVDGLEKNVEPLKIDLTRPKTRVEYFTFIGRDSIEALKTYLNMLRRRGIVLGRYDPLFLKEGNAALKKEGISPYHIQNMLRKIALAAGLIHEEDLEANHYNVFSPHALRESFSSIMLSKGVPDTVVDFWLGHVIGEMGHAYKKIQVDELRRMYVEREQYISISSPRDTVSKRELEERNKQLQTLITNLTLENQALKSKISILEDKIMGIEKNMNMVFEAMKKLEAIVDKGSEKGESV